MTQKTEKEILLAVATPAEWWAWAEKPIVKGQICLRCHAMRQVVSHDNKICKFCMSFSGHKGLGCFDYSKYDSDSEAAIASLIRAGIEKPKEAP